MAISLNPEKANANLKKIEHFEANSKAKIRELALRLKRGNFKVRPSKLDALSHEELNWWKKGDPKCL